MFRHRWSTVALGAHVKIGDPLADMLVGIHVPNGFSTYSIRYSKKRLLLHSGYIGVLPFVAKPGCRPFCEEILGHHGQSHWHRGHELRSEKEKKKRGAHEIRPFQPS